MPEEARRIAFRWCNIPDEAQRIIEELSEPVDAYSFYITCVGFKAAYEWFMCEIGWM